MSAIIREMHEKVYLYVKKHYAELIWTGKWLAHTVTWTWISVKPYLIDFLRGSPFSLLPSFQDHRWTQKLADQPPQPITRNYSSTASSKMLPAPNFNHPDDVVPYLIRHWDLLTMTEVVHAAAWGLDPGFIQFNSLFHFVEALPRINEDELSTMPDCPYCYKPYTSHPPCEIPAVRLPCGHVIAAACLCEWLVDNVVCPQCNIKVSFNPAAQPTQHISNLQHFVALRGLVESGRKFLDEVRARANTGLGSIRVEGCQAFHRWAYAPCENLVGNHDTIVARIHARAHISRWLACVPSDRRR